MNHQLDGTWVLLSGQALPEGVCDKKILSGGHFMFAAYDTRMGARCTPPVEPIPWMGTPTLSMWTSRATSCRLS